MTKWGCLIFISKLVVLLNFAVIALGDEPTSSEFRAFYFIQQWLPSYCNPQGTICCDPSAGKPTPNFTIYGLWPYTEDGTALENCPGERFDVAPVRIRSAQFCVHA
uniref:Uncharacterized protein n=1 Tax=Chenopodium quinoa TaxID=63459 RepID=A0A803MND5_CHEQI